MLFLQYIVDQSVLLEWGRPTLPSPSCRNGDEPPSCLVLPAGMGMSHLLA